MINNRSSGGAFSGEVVVCIRPFTTLVYEYTSLRSWQGGRALGSTRVSGCRPASTHGSSSSEGRARSREEGAHVAIEVEFPIARRRSFVRVLEVDPELADGMDREAVGVATRHLLASTTTLATGLWDPRRG